MNWNLWDSALRLAGMLREDRTYQDIAQTYRRFHCYYQSGKPVSELRDRRLCDGAGSDVE